MSPITATMASDRQRRLGDEAAARRLGVLARRRQVRRGHSWSHPAVEIPTLQPRTC